MPTLPRLLLCLGVVMLSTSTARAEAPGAQRVAVARLDFEGRIPAGLQDLFAQRLVEGLSAARFEVLGGKDVQQKLTGQDPALQGCQTASCYPAMANTLGASYLITARVAESNKTYTIVMEIINGRTGAVLASNRERCETCGAEEAGEKMGLAASALRDRLEAVSRAPARFIIRSRPAGAAVIMDDKPMGTTPLDTELPGGAHHVQLKQSGYDDLSRSFTVVSGVDETLDLDLVALPTRFPMRTVGWGGVAGGVLLMAAGILTMSFDNHEIGCSTKEVDARGHCPWVRSTKWWGASMMGLGAAAATMGGVFLYLAPRPGNTIMGASAGLAGSF
ncbi:MAG TPA: PEGA domain-containing protein [Polyangia bacterium]